MAGPSCMLAKSGSVLASPNNLPSRRIEEQPAPVSPVVEVKHPVQSPGDRVGRSITDAVMTPIVFDEANYRRLIGDPVIDVVVLRVSRNDQQRQAWTIPASAILGPAGDVAD